MKFIKKHIKRGFGHGGPYNPLRYKTYFSPVNYPTDKEIEEIYITHHSIPISPIRNLRHVNPIRQSGPIPPYDGPYTMEDIKEAIQNPSFNNEPDGCHQDPEELMRRVPGLTRKDAEHITTLGLNPDEEVDFAYMAHNIGLDIYYDPNNCYIGRQVVTNSKGEKTEILLSHYVFEEMGLLYPGHNPTDETFDNTWEIFLWGEYPIHPLVDFDLSVPKTWFEYEEEQYAENRLMKETPILPENERRMSSKHPNCSKELFYSQEDLDRFEEMKNPEWTVSNLNQNIYNQKDFISNRQQKENNDPRIL